MAIVLGHLSSDVFYTSPGVKNAYPFLTLEERIVCFMRDLNLFPHPPGETTLLRQHGCGREQQGTPAAEGDDGEGDEGGRRRTAATDGPRHRR